MTTLNYVKRTNIWCPILDLCLLGKLSIEIAMTTVPIFHHTIWSILLLYILSHIIYKCTTVSVTGCQCGHNEPADAIWGGIFLLFSITITTYLLFVLIFSLLIGNKQGKEINLVHSIYKYQSVCNCRCGNTICIITLYSMIASQSLSAFKRK